MRFRRPHAPNAPEPSSADEVWREHVEPGETGPFAPSDGFWLLAPVKELDEAQPLIRFVVAAYEYKQGQWEEIGRGIAHASPVAATWAADSEIDELAAAWFDFGQSVSERNRARWESLERKQATDREREAAQRLADEERARGQEEQRAVAGMLPGVTLDADAAR